MKTQSTEVPPFSFGLSYLGRFRCMRCNTSQPMRGSKIIGGKFRNQQRGRICANCAAKK